MVSDYVEVTEFLDGEDFFESAHLEKMKAKQNQRLHQLFQSCQTTFGEDSEHKTHYLLELFHLCHSDRQKVEGNL